MLRRLPLQNLCNEQLSNQRSYKEEEQARRRQGELYERGETDWENGENNIRTRVLNNLDVLGQELFVLAKTTPKNTMNNIRVSSNFWFYSVTFYNILGILSIKNLN